MNLPTDSGIKAITFRVSGRVQGVSFRWFTRKAAEKLEVGGWVRNRADGDVEGEAFGSSDALERFLDRLREGPRAAVVETLEWEPAPGLEAPLGFEIHF